MAHSRTNNTGISARDTTTDLPEGYELQEITKDGNCLFRAVARGLGLNPNEYHLYLREVAVQYALENLEVIQPIIGNSGLYLANLATEGEWAGDEELNILARALGVNFQVRHTTGNIINITLNPTAPTIYLKYTPGHYEVYAPPIMPETIEQTALINQDLLTIATAFIPMKITLAHIRRYVVITKAKLIFNEQIDSIMSKINIQPPHEEFIKNLLAAIETLKTTIRDDRSLLLLIANATSQLTGIPALRIIKEYKSSDDATSAAITTKKKYTQLHAYLENLKVLINYKDPKHDPKLIPLDTQSFLILRLMNLIELYIKIESIPLKNLQKALNLDSSDTTPTNIHELFRQRLLEEIRSLLTTINIENAKNYSQHLIMPKYQINPTDTSDSDDSIDPEDFEAQLKELANLSLSTVMELLNTIRKNGTEGIIIPTANSTHQIYFYAYYEESHLHLALHNYGHLSLRAHELSGENIKPLHYRIPDTSNNEQAILNYLAILLNIDDLERVYARLSYYFQTYKIEENKAPPRFKQDTHPNCVANGYDAAHLHATIDKPHWHDELLLLEQQILTERLTRADFEVPGAEEAALVFTTHEKDISVKASAPYEASPK